MCRKCAARLAAATVEDGQTIVEWYVRNDAFVKSLRHAGAPPRTQPTERRTLHHSEPRRAPLAEIDGRKPLEVWCPNHGRIAVPVGGLRSRDDLGRREDRTIKWRVSPSGG